MPRNIEIKAHLSDLDGTATLAASIADSGPEHIFQDDTFFSCSNGRLKLRCFTESDGELIFYQRATAAGPKESFYIRSPTADASSLREALTLAYGQAGRVVKDRVLYSVGRTRIHLDRVRNLGEFLELEVVLAEGDDLDAARVEAEKLMRVLQIDPSQLIEDAYVDLLSRTQKT